jgi:hypothetical protein
MERLTEYESIAGYAHAILTGDLDKAIMRLAAYEDVGLEPAEVISMQGEWCAMMAALNSIGGGYGRLRELAEADKDERVVVLPCKPGDTVYSIFGAEVIEKTVGRVIINGYTTPRIWVDLDCSFLSSVTKRWDLGIGKDFFLTREEAEKALEAMKDD